MKRPMTLIGGILGTVFQCFLVYEAFVLAVVFGELLGSDTGSEGVLIMSLIIILLGACVIALVFNAITIAQWAKSPSDFKKKRGYTIAAIVLNFIIVGFALIGFSTSAQITFLAAIELIGLVAASILMIVDLCLEKKRANECAETVVEEQETEEEQIEQPATVQEQQKMGALEEKIMKLNKMKEQGLLDEDEYNELKKKYIREML